ncbi:potassium channel family protein [Thermodesulfatator atlanticus]|uniref:potassium channel family protein n=1 Tax=Thermodesulfatator atlanticus TaxID=501497 RepID=UPI0003B31AAD|nr:potassium channel protein [Thermodesulfatator atlanticus]
MRKLAFSLFLLTLVIVIGTIGYIVIEGWGLFDAFYMTIITLSTVGYMEVHPLSFEGRIFTSLLIFAGVGTAFYVFTMLTETIVSGQLQDFLGRKRLEAKLETLHDHYIICGYGRIGRHICRMIAKEVPFVVVEKDHETVEEIEKEGFLFLEGDATQEEVLKKAGINRAKGLVSVLRSDADNVYITLTARSLNPKLFIIARADEEHVEKKLKRAGSDKVVSPYLIGARRMALTILRPAVTDFLELVTPEEHLELQLEEVRISEKSDLVAKNLLNSQIKQISGVIVLAIKKATGEMIFNPPPEYVFEAGDVVVALGDRKGLARLEELASGQKRLKDFV